MVMGGAEVVTRSRIKQQLTSSSHTVVLSSRRPMEGAEGKFWNSLAVSLPGILRPRRSSHLNRCTKLVGSGVKSRAAHSRASR